MMMVEMLSIRVKGVLGVINLAFFVRKTLLMTHLPMIALFHYFILIHSFIIDSLIYCKLIIMIQISDFRIIM